MLRSEDYPEPRGCQLLQVQVPVAAMMVLGLSVGKAEPANFWSNVTVEAIQKRGFAKGLRSDRWKVCKFMRRGENSDIALFE